MSTSTLDPAALDADALVVDPRIAARRRRVASEQRRRRRRRTLAVALLVTVLAAGWLATRTGLFDVDAVRVSGAVHETDQDVVDVSGVRLGDQLLDLDAGAVARAVEALPWIATVSVERGLDGTVTIAVTERTPVATVAELGGARYLVDAEGRLLGPAEGDTSALVAIEGVGPTDAGQTIDGVGGAMQAWAALGPGVRSRVSAVVVGEDTSLELRLVPEGVAQLGPPTDLVDKADSLATVMGQVDQAGLATISLLDPRNPIVTRR